MMLGTRRGFTLSGSLLLGVLSGCGGGGGGTNTPTAPTTPAAPTQSLITVTAAAPVVTLSPRSGFTYRVTVSTTIVESAGLGANINFVRLREMFQGAEIERSEISSADLIVATGSNRINANQTRNLSLIYDVNDGRATSGILIFNFTDERGNNMEADFTMTY